MDAPLQYLLSKVLLITLPTLCIHKHRKPTTVAAPWFLSEVLMLCEVEEDMYIRGLSRDWCAGK